MKNFSFPKFTALVTVLLFGLANTFAQTTKPKPKPAVFKPIAKFKPPIVKTFLGRNENGATVTVEEAQQLINLPLRIVDLGNNPYTISSYQFLYRKKSIIENEETGKKEIAYTTLSDRFKSSPLPDIWRSNIGGQVQKNEEFYYFDIIVQDKQGRKFFAPELKIKIQ